jgi:hypothetical protein
MHMKCLAPRRAGLPVGRGDGEGGAQVPRPRRGHQRGEWRGKRGETQGTCMHACMHARDTNAWAMVFTPTTRQPTNPDRSHQVVHAASDEVLVTGVSGRSLGGGTISMSPLHPNPLTPPPQPPPHLTPPPQTLLTPGLRPVRARVGLQEQEYRPGAVDARVQGGRGMCG